METLLQKDDSVGVKSRKALLTDFRPVTLQLIESEGNRVIVRGEFARCDTPTENKRVYSHRLWEREIRRLDKPMKERQVYGECDHPSDGKTKLTRASHLLTELRIENGVVIGEAEILDTTSGKDLQAIFAKGGKVGVSSRGYGSVRTDGQGNDIVQDDYRLVTFDFVVDPANVTSYPDVFYEDKDDPMAMEKDSVDFARRIEVERDQARRDLEVSLREEFSRDLISNLAKLKGEIRESVRAELLADPAVAASKGVVESIMDILRPYVLPEDAKIVAEQKDAEIAKVRNQLAEAQLRIKDLEEENGKISVLAKESAYSLYLEQSLAADPDKELIKKLVGNVVEYPSGKELKQRVEAVREELAAKQVHLESVAAEQKQQLRQEKRQLQE
jgi:hypothetical protein